MVLVTGALVSFHFTLGDALEGRRLQLSELVDLVECWFWLIDCLHVRIVQASAWFCLRSLLALTSMTPVSIGSLSLCLAQNMCKAPALHQHKVSQTFWTVSVGPYICSIQSDITLF
ncbi:uncharacterized protein [Littorina saxatilis]|uniref:uncharacterized protein n=1 Tax=Littorina saxatilis TaxID=31220 RepID=UPI0038B5470C